ncbi:SIMPL domain-containing protein [Shewanella sedimentimangrovi]|uniref:SIMPL domain-containing protein n=1 Tax=Shewanella sedimentimangrovi TaxID=2814293 RepID=A0ABX7QZM0_9GAMM|nr:SIMPL domain-containing protein [Shewanella sedimentimangrovi]QSX36992.1 SIMPL domain-containing protein [Shewanella sedimentimangrovi]
MKYFCFFALLAFSSFSYSNNSLPNNRHIAVVGNAQVSATPDIAVIHLEVESLKGSSAEAKTDVDDRVNKLLAGLGKFKIDEKNVSASGISTAPVYSYSENDKRVLDGYRASRNLKVTLNELDSLNALMDFALSVQIDEITRVELKSSKEAELKNEASALAVANAKEKGNMLASAFGATLGNVYSIGSSADDSYGRYGSNSGIERIEVSGSLAKPRVSGKYLQENMVFSASVSVVFDLNVE